MADVRSFARQRGKQPSGGLKNFFEFASNAADMYSNGRFSLWRSVR